MFRNIVHKLGFAKSTSRLRKIRADQWLFASMLLVIVIVYRLYAAIGPDYNSSFYYKDQGEGFLSGHTWTSVRPDPLLACYTDPWKPGGEADPYRVHDYSYYENHYYIYFGPVPSLLLWMPIHLFKSGWISDGILMVVASMIGTCCLCLMVYLIAVRNHMADLWGLLMVLPSIAFGSWVLFILREPFVYEAAIAGAYACSATGALCLWRFLDKGYYRWLGLASLCFGLSVGCRVSHVFDVIVLLLAYGYARRQPRPVYSFRLALYAFIPWLTCIAALVVFNYARFGNPFEMGNHYMFSNLGNMHDPKFRFITPEFYRQKLYFYLLHPLPWKHPLSFPFVHSGFANVIWSQTPRNEWFQEPLYGNWTNNPFSLFFVLFLLDWRTKKRFAPKLRTIVNGLTCYCLAVFAFLLVYFFFSARYQVDFAPWMMAIGGIYYLHLLQQTKTPRYRKLLLITGTILATYSVFTGAMAGYCGYAHCP